MTISMNQTLRRQMARLAAGMLLAGGLAGAAQADPQIQVQGAAAQGLTTNSRLMRFGDLNLASVQGRAKLETRLKVAAGTVCGKRSLWTVSPPADYTRCYDHALGDARQQVQQRVAAGETSVRITAG